MSILPGLLDGLASKRGCTDIKLFDTGVVAVRCFGTWTKVTSVDVKGQWKEIVEGAVDKRRLNDPRGCTTTVAFGPRRYRCNWAKHLKGEMLSLRPLPEKVLDAASYRIPLHLVEYFCRHKSGLILVGGRTGMGKSTTIAALLAEHARQVGGVYVTLENPIEYIHHDTDIAMFVQREIPGMIPSYEQGLMEAMHQNPDCIVVQEIIDRASAQAALAAALTGLKVVATLHAEAAWMLPQRYLSFLKDGESDERWLDSMSACLTAAVVQELMVGTQGLVPIFDIMLSHEEDGRKIVAVQNTIRKGNWSALRQEIEGGSSKGMLTFDGSRDILIRDGLLDEVKDAKKR